jgi:hypothetical protein
MISEQECTHDDMDLESVVCPECGKPLPDSPTETPDEDVMLASPLPSPREAICLGCGQKGGNIPIGAAVDPCRDEPVHDAVEVTDQFNREHTGLDQGYLQSVPYKNIFSRNNVTATTKRDPIYTREQREEYRYLWKNGILSILPGHVAKNSGAIDSLSMYRTDGVDRKCGAWLVDDRVTACPEKMGCANGSECIHGALDECTHMGLFCCDSACDGKCICITCTIYSAEATGYKNIYCLECMRKLVGEKMVKTNNVDMIKIVAIASKFMSDGNIVLDLLQRSHVWNAIGYILFTRGHEQLYASPLGQVNEMMRSVFAMHKKAIEFTSLQCITEIERACIYHSIVKRFMQPDEIVLKLGRTTEAAYRFEPMPWQDSYAEADRYDVLLAICTHLVNAAKVTRTPAKVTDYAFQGLIVEARKLENRRKKEEMAQLAEEEEEDNYVFNSADVVRILMGA